jgi:hypothetical protein
MSYVKQDWKNLPDKTTPFNATRMEYIEDGITSIDMFKNLFNVGNSKITGNSVTFSNTDNQIKINGTSTKETNIFLDSPNANKDKEGIILKVGTYTATIKKVSGSLANNPIIFYLKKSNGTNVYDGTNVFLQSIEAGVSDGTTYSGTFTLTEETRLHWIGYFGSDSRTFNDLVLQFQIEESASATEYTPFAGYVVESGSNTKGNWIKFSDGTMICSAKKELLSVAITNSINNGAFYVSEILTSFSDFPVSFIDKPTSFSMSVSSSGGYGAWIQKMYPPSAANINNFRIIGTWSSTQSFEVSYMAIGCWK